jgi:hypothetical protein
MVVTTRRKKQRLVNQKRLKNQPSLLHENLGLMDEVNRSRNSFKRKPALGPLRKIEPPGKVEMFHLPGIVDERQHVIRDP